MTKVSMIVLGSEGELSWWMVVQKTKLTLGQILQMVIALRNRIDDGLESVLRWDGLLTER